MTLNRYRRLLVIVVSVAALLGVSLTAGADQILVSDIFYDTFMVDALDDLSAQTGIPIVADSTVSGFVTMELFDVPLEDALRRLCIPFGFTFKYMEDGYYLVGAAETTNPTFWLLSEVAVVGTSYLKADVVSRLLSDFYSPFLRVDSQTNSIVVTASPEIIERVQRDIERIDVPIPQVLLEVVVTELSDGGRKALGTDWQWNMAEQAQTPAGALSFTAQTLSTIFGYTYPNGIHQFLLSLKSLVEQSEARIHANPRIVTLNGHEAEIFLGQEQSYLVLAEAEAGLTAQRQRVLVRTGVTLKFLPHISPQGDITVKIEPEVSSVMGLNSAGFPIISSRRASTTIRVRDGEAFVLGGLLQEVETTTVSRVPILGDLPLIGKVFRTERTDRSDTEVVILVTPTIIKGEEG